MATYESDSAFLLVRTSLQPSVAGRDNKGSVIPLLFCLLAGLLKIRRDKYENTL